MHACVCWQPRTAPQQTLVAINANSNEHSGENSGPPGMSRFARRRRDAADLKIAWWRFLSNTLMRGPNCTPCRLGHPRNDRRARFRDQKLFAGSHFDRGRFRHPKNVWGSRPSCPPNGSWRPARLRRSACGSIRAAKNGHFRVSAIVKWKTVDGNPWPLHLHIEGTAKPILATRPGLIQFTRDEVASRYPPRNCWSSIHWTSIGRR